MIKDRRTEKEGRPLSQRDSLAAPGGGREPGQNGKKKKSTQVKRKKKKKSDAGETDLLSSGDERATSKGVGKGRGRENRRILKEKVTAFREQTTESG